MHMLASGGHCSNMPQAGVRSPQCEFDSHDWGILEQCPPDANMCMTSVQVYEGTKVHLRKCGKMEGGFYNIQDNCVDEITEKTSGYLCYCKEDGCNRGHGHNSASHLNISGFFGAHC